MGFLDTFRRGLRKSSVGISRAFAKIFRGAKLKEASDFAELEKILVSSDFGVKSARAIAESVKNRYELGEISADDNLIEALKDEITARLKRNARAARTAPEGMPTVYLFVGVNGSGKTTSIGKLACRLTAAGKKVVLGACDTFRAAAVEQLTIWAERAKCDIVSAKHGADPASVAFDATSAAIGRKADYLLIDTAGRQQNQASLMNELSKICRCISKVYPEAPHETIMTLDSTLGANSLQQAREFSKACNVSGLVLTKIDGTGKGGMAVALGDEFDMPTLFVGLGERPEDLSDFDPEMYAEALLSGETEE
ncbi:MAG: signal recognition particle-docking protein FtsY [Victivallaceae bacterium]|nr:signal recognition particle-docking protein FtsY [Victivallaceae bacterium]